MLSGIFFSQTKSEFLINPITVSMLIHFSAITINGKNDNEKHLKLNLYYKEKLLTKYL